MSQIPHSSRAGQVPTILVGAPISHSHWEADSASSLERRAAPRSVALEYRSWLGWWNEEEFIALACRLIDISRGGAAVEIEELPPADNDVWFCLHPGEKTDCVIGEVVGATRGSRGRHRIRIAFWEPCPTRLLEIALRGSWS